MRYSVMIGGRQHSLVVEQDDRHHWHATLDDVPLMVDAAQLAPDLSGDAGHLSLLIGDRSYDVYVRPLPGESTSDSQSYEALIAGEPYVVELVDERRRALSGVAKGKGGGGEVTIKAPMPGLVVNVLVAPGDTVAHGQRVVVLEAMKMQNDLTSPRAGVVRAVKTETGQAVSQGQPLVVIGDPAGKVSAGEHEVGDEDGV
jgi:biotin carboxyl carrier protein